MPAKNLVQKTKKIAKNKKKKKKRTIHKVVLFFFFSFIAGFMLLEVSFTSQAPEKKWDQPWQDACEETSIVIVDSFYNNKKLETSLSKKEILNIFSIKEKVFGPSLDEDTEEMVYLINNFLNWEAKVIKNPTLEQIKEQLKNKNPVILPANAKKLNNKYMNASGYHVLVISGYDDKKKTFIAQEPGTQFGKNYDYSYKTIESAIKDGYKINNKTRQGDVIFTSNEINDSAKSDGDKDGLDKKDELEMGTSLVSADTDGDGYTDGSKYKKITENENKNEELIRLEFDYKVYLVKDNQKKHIADQDIFKKMKKQWEEIKIIDAESFNSIKTAEPINYWPELL